MHPQVFLFPSCCFLLRWQAKDLLGDRCRHPQRIQEECIAGQFRRSGEIRIGLRR